MWGVNSLQEIHYEHKTYNRKISQKRFRSYNTINKNMRKLSKNAIIIIGNGFDLAHNMKTSYSTNNYKQPQTRRQYI